MNSNLVQEGAGGVGLKGVWWIEFRYLYYYQEDDILVCWMEFKVQGEGEIKILLRM